MIRVIVLNARPRDRSKQHRGRMLLAECIDTPILSGAMSPKAATALRLDAALLDAMRKVKDTEGIPVTTQIEMACREWLKQRGIVVKKVERKRAATLKRP